MALGSGVRGPCQLALSTFAMPSSETRAKASAACVLAKWVPPQNSTLYCLHSSRSGSWTTYEVSGARVWCGDFTAVAGGFKHSMQAVSSVHADEAALVLPSHSWSRGAWCMCTCARPTADGPLPGISGKAAAPCWDFARVAVRQQPCMVLSKEPHLQQILHTGPDRHNSHWVGVCLSKDRSQACTARTTCQEPLHELMELHDRNIMLRDCAACTACARGGSAATPYHRHSFLRPASKQCLHWIPCMSEALEPFLDVPSASLDCHSRASQCSGS